MTTPRILLRSEWGAKPPKTSPQAMPMVPLGNLYHHSTGATLAAEIDADPANDNGDYYAAWMRSIQNYHQGHQGWNDIGYNFTFDPHGNIYEGRGWHVVGAHAGVDTSGHNLLNNSRSHGCCFLGDSNQPGVFTEQAKGAARWLLDHAAFLYGPQVHGSHRDRHATECPGDPLYTWEKAGLPLGGPTLPEPPTVPGNPPTTPPPTQPADWTDALVQNLPTLHHGDNGNHVRQLQALLTSWGYNVKIDGAFGPATESGVKRFQSARSVPGGVDGIAGRNTWTALLSA